MNFIFGWFLSRENQIHILKPMCNACSFEIIILERARISCTFGILILYNFTSENEEIRAF